MKKAKSGHLLVGVLTIWWSFGIVNLLYGLYCHFHEAKVFVVKD